MILIDTSAWIDYLRDADTKVARELQTLIEDGADLVTTEPILMELLAGADTPERANALETLTNGLPLVRIDPRLDFKQAAAVYLAVRRTGKRVRSLVDCLIAAIAMRHEVPVLHKDADYTAIAACLSLHEHTITSEAGS